VICKFCGFLAQVKAVSIPAGTTERPTRVLGAAWGPQHHQIMAGIFHGLYVASFGGGKKLVRIDYVPSHILQATPSVFEPRKPLSETAKRAGWQGFMYNLERLPAIGIHRVYPPSA
jgi:type II restriction enzyme